MTLVRILGYLLLICVAVVAWQVWREEREIARRRQAWFDAHDKLEGE